MMESLLVRGQRSGTSAFSREYAEGLFQFQNFLWDPYYITFRCLPLEGPTTATPNKPPA